MHLCGHLHRMHIADLSTNPVGTDQVRFGPAQNDSEDLFIWLARNRTLLVSSACPAASAVGLFTFYTASGNSISFAQYCNVTSNFAATNSFTSFSQQHKSIISFTYMAVCFRFVFCWLFIADGKCHKEPQTEIKFTHCTV